MSAKSKTTVQRIPGAGSEANSAASAKLLETLRLELENALKDNASLRAAAELLNAPGVESPRGGRWHAPSLLKAARRRGLR
jgi:hypothetical protein